MLVHLPARAVLLALSRLLMLLRDARVVIQVSIQLAPVHQVAQVVRPELT